MAGGEPAFKPAGGGRASLGRTAMTSSIPHIRKSLAGLVVALAAALAGCESMAYGPPPRGGRAADGPMTHTRAAAECWMATEKGHADMDLDKRADVVNKGIEQKMKGAKTAPKN